jgi:hypothetical protein
MELKTTHKPPLFVIAVITGLVLYFLPFRRISNGAGTAYNNNQTIKNDWVCCIKLVCWSRTCYLVDGPLTEVLIRRSDLLLTLILNVSFEFLVYLLTHHMAHCSITSYCSTYRTKGSWVIFCSV